MDTITIQDIYSASYSYNSGIYQEPHVLHPNCKLMEIPVNQYRFELPIMAIKGFSKISPSHNIDAIIVKLESGKYVPRYKTINRYMEDVLICNYTNKLIRLEVGNEDAKLIYYGTHGALFDSEFKPLLMCSWIVETIVQPGLEHPTYKFIQPILRIDPQCFLNMSNPMEKFIAKKMPNLALSTRVSYGHNLEAKFIKVEISSSPFVVRPVTPPSASVSNTFILSAALNHMNDFYDHT